MLNRYRYGWIVAAAFVLATPLYAQRPRMLNLESRESGIEFYLSNYGIFGMNVAGSSSGFIYPRGSNRSYLFGGGLWLGMTVEENGHRTHSAFLTLNPSGGNSWAAPGEYEDSTAAAPIYNTLDYDPVTGLPKSGGGDTALRWPMWAGQSQLVTPLVPGRYVVDNADRIPGGALAAPAFVSGVTEQMVTRCHDGDIRNYERGDAADFPLGLQITQSVYAFKGGPFDNAVIVQYALTNLSADTLRDCIVANVCDPDIGGGSNDHGRFLSESPELRASYFWTDNEQTGTYGALATTLLEAPVTDDNGNADETLRSHYQQFGRVGSAPRWTIYNDPMTSEERYTFMASNAFATDGRYADLRGMLASTPFHLLPGHTTYIAIGYIVIPLAQDQPISADRVQESVGRLTAAYYSPTFVSGVTAGGTDASAISIAAVPNSTNATTTIRYVLPHRGDAVITVCDALGRELQRETAQAQEAGAHTFTVDMTGEPSGLYWIRVHSGGTAAAAALHIVR